MSKSISLSESLISDSSLSDSSFSGHLVSISSSLKTLSIISIDLFRGTEELAWFLDPQVHSRFPRQGRPAYLWKRSCGHVELRDKHHVMTWI